MAERSKSGRRLRWLVLAGLAGAGVWIIRNRRSRDAGRLDTWPAAEPIRPAAAQPPVSNAPAPVPAEPVATTPSVAAAEPAAAEPAVPPVEMSEIAVLGPPNRDVGHLGGNPAGAEPALAGEALFTPTEPAPAITPARPVRPSPSPRPRPAAAAVDEHPPGSALPLPDGSAPGPEFTIKGNVDSMLFHRPDSPYYARTRAEVWFRTATDARAAGFAEWTPKKRDES